MPPSVTNVANPRATLHWRVLIRRLHLWLGFSAGALFALLGLTGSALVFYIEIDAALNSDSTTAANAPAPGWDSQVWDIALATARSRFHDPAGKWSFEVTGEPGTIPARYYPSSAHQGHHAEREMVWFSADGARIVRSEPWGGYPMSWIYELHMHLLAGETGRLIVGWTGFSMLLLLVSGLAVWWPRGSWHKALAFKRNAVPTRRLRDLHKLSGIWSFGLLIVLVFTGALLALPDVKGRILSSTVATPDPVPDPVSTRSSGQQISIAQALVASHAAMPDARLAFIDIPGQGNGAFRMRVQVPGDPHRRFPSSFVFVDQFSGKVLAVHDIRRSNASTTISIWLRGLHDGSVAGLSTRILAVLLGFVPAALFVTGLLHWLRRLKARLRPPASHLNP